MSHRIEACHLEPDRPAGTARTPGRARTSGTARAAGASGPAGVGSQSAWFVDNAWSNQVGFGGRATETLVTLDLPAGKYALDASIFGSNNDSDTQSYSCTLHSPATIFASGGNGGGFVSISDGFAPAPATD
jgi:hypothetical protein